MYAFAPTNRYYMPTICVDEGYAEVTIVVRQDFFHSAGTVHGSVYFKALDDAAFFAVNSLVNDVFVLTVSFNIYLTRPISQGQMKAIGQAIHRSQRLFIAQSKLVDSDGREIGWGSGTYMRSATPLSAKLGYE